MRVIFGLGVVALLGACSNPRSATPPLTFNRPEHLGFVCLDTLAVDTDREAESLVRPMRCCSNAGALAPEDSTYPRFKIEECSDVDDEGNPIPANNVLHTLVTQSTRGEVAAVDLSTGRVIDSDTLIPGYTFVDVGGIPSAIVVPTGRPTKNGEVWSLDQTEGPKFTYVAVAEELYVRAVATCRFRAKGGRCGPETGEGYDPEAVKVPLPSPPSDMLLAPDGSALWITLPDLGLLARVDLAGSGNLPFPVREVTKLDANKKPIKVKVVAEPTYFALSSIGDAVPAEPVSEESNYRGGCGLGYALSERPTEFNAPSASHVISEDGPRPTRLRFDALTNLLLVGDQSESAVRAFDIRGGAPVPRGQVLTGAPVRDFVVTPYVPAELLEGGGDLPLPALALPGDSVRYLYGIDDREGLVFVQRLEFDQATQSVSGTPLKTPYRTTRFNDRLSFGGSALALEIIDTRDLSVPACGVALADYTSADGVQRVPTKDRVTLESESALDDRATKAEKAFNAKLKALREADKTDAEIARDNEYRELAVTLNRAVTQQEIYDSASPSQLRGVFLAVTTTNGTVRIADIFDLDVYCRAAKYCEGPTGQDISTDAKALPVAVQRHASRVYLGTNVTARVSDAAFAPLESCPEGFRPVLDEEGNDGRDAEKKPIVCMRSEPWLNFSGTATLIYEGYLPTFATEPMYGYLLESGGDVVLQTEAIDFCARGISPKDAAGKVSDVVAVLGQPSPGVDGCEAASTENPVLLSIKSAHSDHLVLDGTDPDLAEIFRCYPDSIRFGVRAQGEFIVNFGSALILPAVTADEAGECTVDPAGDPQATFRARVGERFVGTNLSFTVRELGDNAYERDDDLAVYVTSVAEPVSYTIVDARQGRPDALPVTLQYLPYTGDLFIVDTASQGLRRLGLRPFGTASTGLR